MSDAPDGSEGRDALVDAIVCIPPRWKFREKQEKVRALLRAHDARVWEEAAKVCEEEAEKHRKHDDPCRMDAARWCAAALRARAPKGEKP